MAIIPNIDAIVLFFALSESFDHRFIVKKTITTTARPKSIYFGISNINLFS